MDFPIDRFRELPTPFYYYDTALPDQPLQTLQYNCRPLPKGYLTEQL